MNRVAKALGPALALALCPSLDAEAQDCSCRSQAGTGSVVSVQGEAMIAGAEAVEEATTGVRLGQGSLLFTGAGSNVVVRFGGGCDVTVGPDATLSIGRMDGALCPVVSGPGGSLVQSGEPSKAAGNGGPVAEPAARLQAMRSATAEISP